MNPKGSKRRLGRGLDGLLPAQKPAPRASATARIEELAPGAGQPRRYFDDQALSELADSIATHGVLEPILVRKSQSADTPFEIIAGERRWRAAGRAGLKEVPIFVRDLNDEDAFAAALVENLQREDLNPIETARAFQRLMDEFGHSQSDVAERVGKSRASVANSVRLLQLPEEVLVMLEEGRLSEGHGRALLTREGQKERLRLARSAAEKRWSVRETERQARKEVSEKAPKASAKSANVRDLERRLSHAMGAPVTVEEKPGQRGEVKIAFASYDELDVITSKLLR